MRICETCVLILVKYWDLTDWKQCNLTPLVFHMKDVSPIDECGWTRTCGVKRDANKSFMTIELIFAYDWQLQNEILLGFPCCSWWMKCLQVLSWSSAVWNYCWYDDPPSNTLWEEKRIENSAGRSRRSENRRSRWFWKLQENVLGYNIENRVKE